MRRPWKHSLLNIHEHQLSESGRDTADSEINLQVSCFFKKFSNVGTYLKQKNIEIEMGNNFRKLIDSIPT